MTATSDSAERISDCELQATREINGPAHLVWEAWTKAELFQQWWVPSSFPVSLIACELDVRVGGGYRLVFAHEGSTAEFFGRYLEVVAPSRLVWTNDEGEGGQVTTVTLTETDGRTLVTVHDRYPSKEVLDAEIASGSTGAMPEQLEQLDALVAGPGA